MQPTDYNLKPHITKELPTCKNMHDEICIEVLDCWGTEATISHCSTIQKNRNDLRLQSKASEKPAAPTRSFVVRGQVRYSRIFTQPATPIDLEICTSKMHAWRSNRLVTSCIKRRVNCTPQRRKDNRKRERLAGGRFERKHKQSTTTPPR